MPLIKENVNEVLNQLVGDCFAMNRLLDRQMSVLSIKFVMSNTSKVLHPLLAHAYPMLADKVSDYQGSRNCLTVYPSTPIGNEDYITPLDVFSKMLEKQLEIEENISDAISFAYEEGDMTTKVFLQSFLNDVKRYTEQILLLVDKARMYGDMPKHWMDFDASVDTFIIL